MEPFHGVGSSDAVHPPVSEANQARDGSKLPYSEQDIQMKVRGFCSIYTIILTARRMKQISRRNSSTVENTN